MHTLSNPPTRPYLNPCCAEARLEDGSRIGNGSAGYRPSRSTTAKPLSGRWKGLGEGQLGNKMRSQKGFVFRICRTIEDSLCKKVQFGDVCWFYSLVVRT